MPVVFYIIPKCTGNLPEGGITMLRETFNQAVVRALRVRPAHAKVMKRPGK